MVKVSISLPNNTQITFESEESEVLHEIVGMVLRDLPRDLMQPLLANDVQNEVQPPGGLVEKSTSVAGSALSASVTTAPEPALRVQPESVEPQTQSTGPTAAPVPAAVPELARSSEPGRSDGIGAGQAAEITAAFLSEDGRTNFAAFCRESNPLGDMRRVVVAAEGARRHFGVDGVNADDLGGLFDIAGWRRPGNFTQTLRNAARSKFGWLERIPGRSGRYAATSLGISTTLHG